MKLEIILWIFCILVLLFLTAKISLESTEYDCDKCTATLSNSIADSTYFEVADVKISKLIEEYKDGKCSYIWDPVQGYIKYGY